jgi:FeS assembly SUF system protein
MAITPLSTSKLKPNSEATPPAPTSQRGEHARATDFPGKTLQEKVVSALKTCYDPELPVNIYELGLIYKVEVTPENAVNIQMTLTTPACPVAGSLPGQVKEKVASIPGIGPVKVDLVWDPPWDMNRLSEAAKLQLGLY